MKKKLKMALTAHHKIKINNNIMLMMRIFKCKEMEIVKNNLLNHKDNKKILNIIMKTIF